MHRKIPWRRFPKRCGVKQMVLSWMCSAYEKRLVVDALHPIYAHLQHPGFLEQCREEKLPLHVWTVNTKERFRQMQKAGVNAVITNFPDIPYW